MQIIIVVCLVFIGAIGTLLLKIGASDLSYGQGLFKTLLSVLKSPPLLCGVGLQFIPLTGWIVLLKTMPLTKLQPMIALTYVVTPLLAVLVLGEHLTLMRLLGIGIIVVGVALVSMS